MIVFFDILKRRINFHSVTSFNIIKTFLTFHSQTAPAHNSP
jgi:hypothetical protein